MRHLRKPARAALVPLVLCLFLPCDAAAANRLLWQIGTPDGSYREFAAAGRYAAYARSFPHDVTYHVGRSRPGKGWSYIHPGPSDFWAGSSTHPFRIDFDLSVVPRTPCRLNVYLVDSRHDSAQVLEIDVNGRRSFRFPVVPGAVEDSLTDPGAGRQSAVALPFPPSLLRPGRNRITLTVVSASWLLYDAVSLGTGPTIPSSPRLVEVSARVGANQDASGGSATIEAYNTGTEGEAMLALADRAQDVVRAHAAPGPNTFSLPVPADLRDRPLHVSVAAGGRVQAVDVQSPQFVWRIGRPDRDYREFAIARNYPAYSSRFPGDANYNVDTSRPDRDWPFIHPGPNDGWAGARRHPFRIAFTLPAVPAGAARLNVDVVDTQPLGGPVLEVDVNGRARYRLQLPAGGSDNSLTDPTLGHAYKLAVPISAHLLRTGSNELTLTVVSGSWLTYDALSLETGVGLPDGPRVEGVAAATTALFRRVNGALRQVVRLVARNTGVAGDVQVRLRGGSDVRQAASLAPGENTVDLLVPPAGRAALVEVTVQTAGREQAARFVAQPERRWKVFVGPSTHTDIGYTDWQERVYARHNENTAGALAACDALPEFKWNLEVGYQAELFRAQGTRAYRSLLARIKEGRIGLGALYLNMLTGLCSGEELARAVTFVQETAREAGGKAEAANLTDVPTAVGTLPMMLAQSGVRYFADGANDVIPFTWGGRQMDQSPYWWQGLDGSRVLAISTRAYAHAGTVGLLDDVATIEQRLPGWLRQIGREGYPCDAAYVYGAFSDNQPMSPRYAEVAAAWNARWEYPKIIVGRVDEFFRCVEHSAGRKLPVVRGDLGVMWEDGAASSALETAMVRRAKARLDAAERWHALSAALGPASAFPAAEIRAAWDQVLLFDEHTWGAAGSVTDPEGEQTRHQWAVKAGFAHEAVRLADSLLKSGLQAPKRGTGEPGRVGPARIVTVYNEHSWPRDIVAACPSPGSSAHVRVTEVSGRAGAHPTAAPVQCQVEGDRVIFVARQVPSLGWKSYRIQAASAPSAAQPLLHRGADEWSWETPSFRLKVGRVSGALTSLYDKDLHTEWARPAGGYGINQFLYVLGGDGVKTTDQTAPIPGMRVYTHSGASVTVAENGPTRAVVRIRRAGRWAPATDTYLILGPGRRIEFLNVVHKAPTLTKEAGYFAFPFRLSAPGPGRAFVELPYGAMEVEKDQAPGACRAWYATNSFAAVTDGRRTAVLATPHAPMLTFGDVFRGRQREHVRPIDGAVFAYAFNNIWGTNYKASQGGDIVFAFSLDLRAGPFNPAAATRFGWDTLAAMGDPGSGGGSDPWAFSGVQMASVASGDASPASLLRLSDGAVVVGGISRHSTLLQVRLYNPSARREEAALTLPGRKLAGAWAADLTGAPKARLPVLQSGTTVRAAVPARGLATVLLRPAP